MTAGAGVRGRRGLELAGPSPVARERSGHFARQINGLNTWQRPFGLLQRHVTGCELGPPQVQMVGVQATSAGWSVAHPCACGGWLGLLVVLQGGRRTWFGVYTALSEQSGVVWMASGWRVEHNGNIDFINVSERHMPLA